MCKCVKKLISDILVVWYQRTLYSLYHNHSNPVVEMKDSNVVHVDFSKHK